MNNPTVVRSLNEAQRKRTLMLFLTVCTAVFLIVFAISLMCNPAFAAGGGETFIGTSGKTLLSDIAIWVALGGIGFGILQIVKGRMAIGVIGLVVTALFYAFATNAAMFGTLGSSIAGIFGVGN